MIGFPQSKEGSHAQGERERNVKTIDMRLLMGSGKGLLKPWEEGVLIISRRVCLPVFSDACIQYRQESKKNANNIGWKVINGC